MREQELRKEERFPAAVLPRHLQTVKILLAGQEISARVVDASYSGFGFQIDWPLESFVLGSSLVIYPEGTVKALYGVVVFAKFLDRNRTRVGVQLREVGQFMEYRTELKELISLVAEASD